MNKLINFLFLMLLLIGSSVFGNPMPSPFWSQPPHAFGWNVYASNSRVIADDFMLNEYDRIVTIYFWGSWRDDVLPLNPFYFHLSIHADIPDPDGSGPAYSMPGEELWVYDALPELFIAEEVTGINQGWYKPQSPTPPAGEFFPTNEYIPYRYMVVIPEASIFTPIIDNQVTLWLAITAVNSSGLEWGWKNSYSHWNNNAVWSNDPSIPLSWTELFVPLMTEGDLAFEMFSYDMSKPVELSAFTGIFNSTTCNSTLNWTTQSESGNLGWNIYRAESQAISSSIKINAQIIPGAGSSTVPVNYEYQDEIALDYQEIYYYWLENVNSDGSSELHGPIVVNTFSEEENPESPAIFEQYGLLQNYPNPFNPDTEISFTLDKAGDCELLIFDNKGRKVKTLFQGNIEADHNYNFTWNGRNDNDKPVASGVYHCKIKSGKYNSTKKMILIK